MSPHKYLTDLNADEKMDFEFGIWWIKKISFFSKPPILNIFSLKFKEMVVAQPLWLSGCPEITEISRGCPTKCYFSAKTTISV